MGDVSAKIRALRLRLRLRQGQLAARVGVTQATVSRWENGAEPDFDHMQRLADLAGESVEDFAGHSRPAIVKVSGTQVIGAVEAGVWRPAAEWPEDDFYEVYWVPKQEFIGIPTFGLEVHGPSMDRIYPEGSIVVCVRLAHINREPRSGERVVVYSRRPDGFLEATLKEYVKENGTIWLWPRSTNPHHQAPIVYGESVADSELEVEVHAVVIGSYRPE